MDQSVCCRPCPTCGPPDLHACLPHSVEGGVWVCPHCKTTHDDTIVTPATVYPDRPPAPERLMWHVDGSTEVIR